MNETKTQSLSIIDRIKRGDLLVSDGATGTYLENHGLEPGGCPEEMNASQPDVIKGMARDYFDAGSDLVLTNTFGANKFMLKKYGHGDRVSELNSLAAQHARSQAPSGHYVVGSMGPTGEFLEPLGEVTEAEMLDAFTEQAIALEDGGADAVVIETMTATEEANLAIKAAKVNTNLTVIATMTFDPGPRGLFTMMGVTPARAAKELQEAGADIVGANCGNGIEVMVRIAEEMREATNGYMLIHSNAGLPKMVKGEIIYTELPDYMADHFKTLADLGINILGGCCGTEPAHIRALAAVLNK